MLGFVALYALGFWYLHQEVQTQVEREPGGSVQFLSVFLALMTLLGLWVVTVMGTVLALFLSVGTISGEIESGSLLAVLTKPLRRHHVVFGKWLGHSALVTAYMLGTTALVLAVAMAISGYVPPRPLHAVALMVCSALLMLAVSLAGSTFLPTLSNGVVAFLLFGIGWMGGFVESLGIAMDSTAMVNIGIVTSLIVPSDALWRAASFYLQPAALLAVQSATQNPGLAFASGTPPAPAMLAWSAIYLVGMVCLAVAIFNKRDV
jgi:Cu-processing system permease protein